MAYVDARYNGLFRKHKITKYDKARKNLNDIEWAIVTDQYTYEQLKQQALAMVTTVHKAIDANEDLGKLYGGK